MEINWKKNVALFLIGQALSLFGTAVVQYAILWHITLKSQSGTMMTLFTVVGFLPMFFISPFAGVWADRFNRKYIINISDGAIAFFSLAVAIFLIFGIENYGILLICAFVRSVGQGVQMPAVGAFIPQIVPEEHLTRVNGFQGSIHSFVTLSSPMLSGALMAFAPLETLFFLDVITAVIGISIVFFLVKVPVNEKTESNVLNQKETLNGDADKGQSPLSGRSIQSTDYFHDLKEGLKYIRKQGYVLRMIIITAVFLFAFTPAALLTPLQVTRNFGADVWRLTAIEIAFSAGMMAGGILIGLWGGFKNRVYTMAFSCVISGLLACALGFSPSFWLYLAIMAVMGLSVPLYNTPAMVMVQTTVEPAFMGRVISVFAMVSSTMFPLGMLVFGPVADRISIDILLVITGLLAASAFIPMISSKALREAGRAHLQNEQNI